jgi:endogenous inhibitor of DNA gyrase (YacG/DUF329 family)
MKEPRQRNIPLNINERRELDQYKEHYESLTGDTGDWGKFLSIATLAGLAALGIYSLAQATKRSATIWQVNCPNCPTEFPIQVPNPPPWRITQVVCPDCETELVIDFTKPASILLNGQQSNSNEAGDTVYTAYCPYCDQPIELGNASYGVNPRGAEYLKCPTCNNVAKYAVLGVE